MNAVFCKESRLGVSYTIKAGIRAVGEIYDSVKKKICPVQEAHDFVRKEHCFVKNESSFERKDRACKNVDYLMFTVADQPNLSEQSIEALIGAAGQRFRQGYTSQPPTFSLCCRERVGNPCMFRADLIQELMQLEGDKGGRSVLKKHECCYVEIENEEEFSDIDTEEQMKRNRQAEKNICQRKERRKRMKKSRKKEKDRVWCAACSGVILMPQKMTNAAGNTVPTAVDNLYGIFKKQGKYGRNRQRIYAGSL